MKSTRYFNDYQSAYNYYGGNVVPSTEIALIGDGSYIFVSSDNAVSGNQQYFDVSMTNDEIVDTMTYTAYNNGVSYGEAVGFETGYTAGTTYGEAIGYAQGYEGGYSYGYTEGLENGAKLPNTVNDYSHTQFCVEIVDEPNEYTNEFYGDHFRFNDEFYVEQYLLDGDSWDDVVFEYTKDGTNWTSPEPYLTRTENDFNAKYYAIPVELGDVIKFRAQGAEICLGSTAHADGITYNYDYYSMWFRAFGNAKSLMTTGDLDDVDGTMHIDPEKFYNIYFYTSTITDAQYLQLPLPLKYDSNEDAYVGPDNGNDIYDSTFSYSHYLINGPVLPSNGTFYDDEIIIPGDYPWFSEMFKDCYTLQNLVIPCYKYNGDGTGLFNDAFINVHIDNITSFGTYDWDDNDNVFVVHTLEIFLQNETNNGQWSVDTYVPIDDSGLQYINVTSLDPNLQINVTTHYYDFAEVCLNPYVDPVLNEWFLSFTDALFYYTDGNESGYDQGYADGEASGGSGTSLTDEQLNALSKGNLANYISSGEWENYTSGTVNYVPVYDTYGMTIDAEWMKKIIVSIDMLTLNGGDCQPVFVEKIVNGIPIHQTITLNSSTDDYLSATISLSTGDKVGFSLVECEADNATGEVMPYYGMWLIDDSQIDQQSGDPIYTHWIEVDDDGDYEAKWTLGTDPESGDSTIEFSFELVPGE